MLRTEIIRTCSHEAVAAAALRSLDSVFCARVTLIACARGASPGAYAASLIRRFEQEATEDGWYALGAAIARRDMPVLEGFRFIVENMVDNENIDDDRETELPASARGGGLDAKRFKSAVLHQPEH